MEDDLHHTAVITAGDSCIGLLTPAAYRFEYPSVRGVCWRPSSPSEAIKRCAAILSL